MKSQATSTGDMNVTNIVECFACRLADHWEQEAAGASMEAMSVFQAVNQATTL